METVTIIRIGEPSDLLPADDLFPEPELLAGSLDAQGNPIRATPVEVESGGWFIPGNNGGAEEAATYGESDVAKLTIYNRGNVEVHATDAVEFRGNVWKIVGVVEAWASPWGSSLGGTAVTLERVG